MAQATCISFFRPCFLLVWPVAAIALSASLRSGLGFWDSWLLDVQWLHASLRDVRFFVRRPRSTKESVAVRRCNSRQVYGWRWEGPALCATRREQ